MGWFWLVAAVVTALAFLGYGLSEYRSGPGERSAPPPRAWTRDALPAVRRDPAGGGGDSALDGGVRGGAGTVHWRRSRWPGDSDDHMGGVRWGGRPGGPVRNRAVAAGL